MDIVRLIEACKGKSYKKGGLNLPEFKEELSDLYPSYKKRIRDIKSRKELSFLCIELSNKMKDRQFSILFDLIRYDESIYEEEIDINYETDEKQIERIRDDYREFRKIKKPTERVQLKAVKQDSHNLKYIKNPSLKIQIDAIERNPEALRFIKDPLQITKKTAINISPMAFMHIKNPTREDIINQIKYQPERLKTIINPTEEEIERMVDINPLVVLYVDNPTDEQILDAIEKSPRFTLSKFPNLSVGMQMKIVKQDPSNYRYIINPSVKLESYIANKFGSIKNPTEEMKQIFISKYPQNLSKIQNPSDKVLKIAIEKYPENIFWMQGKGLLTLELAKIAIQKNRSLIEDFRDSDELMEYYHKLIARRH